MVINFINRMANNGMPAPLKAFVQRNLISNPSPSNKTNLAVRDRSFLPTSRQDNRRVQFIDPSSAIKSDIWSRNALEFINAANSNVNIPYSEQQLLQAYMTSVYMFSALRRVANLISRVKIVAEVKDGQRYVRAPETARINQIFYKEGGQLLSRVWLNYAVYGSSVIYKVKSRRAILEEQDGRPIYDYKDGAVAGLKVLDKPLWDLDEDVAHGELKGLFVNQYDAAEKILENRNYLYRKEFVYSTDWNPENPNRGRSIVAVAIHEAVANAAIAQWMSEYFTRGAMPFIMVALAEDDPAVMTDSDLQQYRRQIEEYSQGIGSSLRSVFFDRRVSVEQVGISADEVAAPELNTTALEGISAAVGLDRELIVTPEGGSQERHDALIKRAWDDTVIPLAKKFLEDLNRDLGLPENMRLVLDLSEISELDADREEKASTEISVYESGLETYNEARTRLKMPPVKELDGWFYFDGKPMPINNILEASGIPSQTVVDFAMQLWDGNLAKRSQVLEILGKKLGENERDGYKVDIEESFSFIQGLWGDDLLTRRQVLNFMGYDLPQGAEDGYRSELERGADYGEFITGLWSDNLLTRSQTIKLLDMGIELPPNTTDGFAADISEYRSSVMDMWSNNLVTRKQAMDRLGIGMPNDNAMFIDDYSAVVDATVSRESGKLENRNSEIKDWWDTNLITREEAMQRLGISLPKDKTTGFKQEVEVIEAGLAEKELADMTKEEGDDGGGGDSGGGGSNWRSILPKPSNPRPSAPTIYVNEEPLDFDNDYRYEINNAVQSEEAMLTDDAMAGAEEDLLSGYGEYIFDPLESFYDEYVDIYPAETLPVDEDYVDIFDNPDTEEDDWLYEEASSQGRYPYHEKDPDEETESYRTSKDIVGRMAQELDSNIDIDALELKAFEDTYRDIYQLTKPSDSISEKEILQDFMNNSLLEDSETVEFELPEEILSDMVQAIYFSEEDIEEKENNELYACAWIGENENIQVLQDKLKEIMGDDPDINWQDPSTFHITLVYALDVNDEQLENVTSVLPKEIQSFTLEANDIGLFENENETVVYLKISRNDLLEEAQAKLFSAFSAYALQVSDYSIPGEFNPHITLAYLPAGSNVPDMSFDTFEIDIKNIFLGRDNYEMVKEIPLVNKMIRFELSSEREDYVPPVDADLSTTGDNKTGTSVSYQDENKDELKPSYQDFESSSTPENLMLETEVEQEAENWRQTLRNNFASRIEKMILGKDIEESFDGLPEIIKNTIAEYGSKSEDGIEVLKSIKQAVEAGAFDNDEINIKTLKTFVAHKAKQDGVEQEIRAWEKATLRSGVKKGLKFETVHVPQDTTNSVKEKLKSVNPLDNGEIKSVFEEARKALGID